jgi:hypothetical protein
MTIDPRRAFGDIASVVDAARQGDVDRDQVLAALTALRLVRDELSVWEPELIAAARVSGASWAALAPALGVGSRQAAERRYLRLQPSGTGETTAEGRVDAARDRRAGDKAVAEWARRNAATLRQLACQVSALGDLGADGQTSVDRLGAALGTDDPVDLLQPLVAAQQHLAGPHPRFAARLGEIGRHTDQLRRDAVSARQDNRHTT